MWRRMQWLLYFTTGSVANCRKKERFSMIFPCIAWGFTELIIQLLDRPLGTCVHVFYPVTEAFHRMHSSSVQFSMSHTSVWVQCYFQFSKRKGGVRCEPVLLLSVTYLDSEGTEYSSCSGWFLWPQPPRLVEVVGLAPGLGSLGWWGWFQSSCWGLDQSLGHRLSLQRTQDEIMVG